MNLKSVANSDLLSLLLPTGKPNKTIYRELQMSDGNNKAHINALYRNPGAVYTAEAALAA